GHATTGAMPSISLPSGSKSVRTEEARRKATTGSASSSPSSASASSSHAAASGPAGTDAVLPDADGGADRVSPAGDTSVAGSGVGASAGVSVRSSSSSSKRDIDMPSTV